MSLHLTRLWWWLLGLAVGAVLAAVAFAIGLELGLKRGNALAQPEIATLLEERQSVLAELAALHGEVSKLRHEASVMERSRQIERETNKALQAQLKDAQDDRLALIKEGTYLKRLVREGGQGAVSVHDLVLSPQDDPRSVRYSFVVTQLIPDFGATTGQVSLQILGLQEGKEKRLGLKQLPQAEPTELPMHFDQLQSFQGQLTLPEGFEPRLLTVTVDPEGERLTGASESFPWVLEGP